MSLLARSSPTASGRGRRTLDTAAITSSTSSSEARPQRRKTLRPSLFLSLSPRGSPRVGNYHPNRSSKRARKMEIASSACRNRQPQLLQWVQTDGPSDIVPHILAFCGPQTMVSLHRTSRRWRDLVLDDRTWRMVCEDLYKWKEGDPLPTMSWREFYQNNPCVPIDYPSIPAALAKVTVQNNNRAPQQQTKSIRILLRPATYILREAICIQALEHVQVSIETMTLPFGGEHSINHPPPPKASKPKSPVKKIAKRAASLRNRLTCRTVNVERLEPDVDDDDHPFSDESIHESARSASSSSLVSLSSSSSSDQDQAPPAETTTIPPPKRATLVLRTRRQNEPIVRVCQGALKLSNLEFLHHSPGTDIWNGNAAIQIQPPVGQDDRPVVVEPRPSATLENLDITSKSGRGIVNIDGGAASISHCYVHECAATGIYVGGPGSTAAIENTDVIRNGIGNRWNRRGIARGHSGIYLEQGRARIVNCNVSLNSLTGISAISDSNAILNLEASDLVANGTEQLELPNEGSMARRLTLTRNNRMATQGWIRSRSGLMEQEDARDEN